MTVNGGNERDSTGGELQVITRGNLLAALCDSKSAPGE
jgi:hypothetical protein